MEKESFFILMEGLIRVILFMMPKKVKDFNLSLMGPSIQEIFQMDLKKEGEFLIG